MKTVMTKKTMKSPAGDYADNKPTTMNILASKDATSASMLSPESSFNVPKNSMNPLESQSNMRDAPLGQHLAPISPRNA
jgi:hypothetical protein